MEKILDQETGQNLYEIAKNLPYQLSVQELERLYDLLLQNLTENQKRYFQNLYDRRHYWSRAYNKANSLDSHCTGMVENINKHLKSHVSLKCSLVEYLYRVILFSNEFNNHNTLPVDEEASFETRYSLLQHNPFVINTKDQVSKFALKKIVICCIKSISWKSR